MAGLTAWQTQYTNETRTYAVDMSQDMDPGDILGAVTATLTDTLTGVVVSGPPMLPGTVTGSGATISVTVSALTAGHNYRLMVNGAMGGTKITSAPISIACPY